MLSAAMSPYSGKGSDEQTLLRSMQQPLESGDILLGDAFYQTFFLIAAMLGQGADILMEQLGVRRRETDFRRGKKVGQRDHIVTLKKPKKKPDWMKVRISKKGKITSFIQSLINNLVPFGSEPGFLP